MPNLTEETFFGRPAEKVLVETRPRIEAGACRRHLEQREHDLLGARGKRLARRFSLTEALDVAGEAGDRAAQRCELALTVARFVQDAREPHFRRGKVRDRAQDGAKLVLGAVEIAELLQVDLAQSTACQDLGSATLGRRAAEHADGFVRVRQAELERSASDVREHAGVEVRHRSSISLLWQPWGRLHIAAARITTRRAPRSTDPLALRLSTVARKASRGPLRGADDRACLPARRARRGAR